MLSFTFTLDAVTGSITMTCVQVGMSVHNFAIHATVHMYVSPVEERLLAEYARYYCCPAQLHIFKILLASI